MDKWIDEETDKRMDRQTDNRIDEETDKRIDGETDKRIVGTDKQIDGETDERIGGVMEKNGETDTLWSYLISSRACRMSYIISSRTFLSYIISSRTFLSYLISSPTCRMLRRDGHTLVISKLSYLSYAAIDQLDHNCHFNLNKNKGWYHAVARGSKYSSFHFVTLYV